MPLARLRSHEAFPIFGFAVDLGSTPDTTTILNNHLDCRRKVPFRYKYILDGGTNRST